MSNSPEPGETPGEAQGTTESVVHDRHYQNVTQRQARHERTGDDTSQPYVEYPDGTPGMPPLIVYPAPEIGTCPRVEDQQGSTEFSFTPMTGRSSDVQDIESDDELLTDEEQDDVNVEARLSVIWATYGVNNAHIRTALRGRIIRHIDEYLVQNDQLNLSDKEYSSLVLSVATIEAARYAAKKMARGTSTPSVTSSHPGEVLEAKGPSAVAKGKRPIEGPRTKDNDSSNLGRAPDSVKLEIVPPSDAALATPTPSAPSGNANLAPPVGATHASSSSSTTEESGTRRPFRLPPPPDWVERVNAQKARNGAFARGDTTIIPDQGVAFEGNCPYDLWGGKAKPPKDAPPASESEEEDDGDTPLPISSKTAMLVNARKETTRLPRVVQPRPLSQPHYAGSVNPFYDPLMGPTELDEDPISDHESVVRDPDRTDVADGDRVARNRSPSSGHGTRDRPRRERTLVEGRNQRSTGDARLREPTFQPRPVSANHDHLGYEHVGWEGERHMRGFSMPPVTHPPTIPAGVRATDSHYRETMVNRLMHTITEALGVPLRFPDGYKPNLKNDGIRRYSGSSKFSELENWLATLVYRYALLKFGGSDPDMDCIRVLTLVEYLEGDALTWYTTHILSAKRTVARWRFCDTIVALYDRYVLPSSMQDARENFRKVRYTATLGVQGFYDALLEHAQNMAIYPDSYTIMEEFMSGLPQAMLSRCFRDHRLTVEANMLEDWVSAAKEIERCDRMESYYKDRSRNTAPTLSSPTASKPAPRPTPSRGRYGRMDKGHKRTP
jgi:hypothetical protein